MTFELCCASNTGGLSCFRNSENVETNSRYLSRAATKEAAFTKPDSGARTVTMPRVAIAMTDSHRRVLFPAINSLDEGRVSAICSNSGREKRYATFAEALARHPAMGRGEINPATG